MRPLAGQENRAEQRSRTTSFTDNEITPQAGRQLPQMNYFFAKEDDIGESQPQSTLPKLQDAQSRGPASKLQDSPTADNFGIESLASTVGSLSPEMRDMEDKNGTSDKNGRKIRQKIPHTLGLNNEELGYRTTPSPSKLPPLQHGTSSHHTVAETITTSSYRSPNTGPVLHSEAFTPLSYNSTGPASIVSSSFGSRRSSLSGSELGASVLDDTGSQAVVSSGEDELDSGVQMIESGNAPQLVMPSIKMPSRRPFTERGKYIGRLKVLIAGDSGTGKTSLIKAIVQDCEDIVHIDPLTTAPFTTSTRKASKSRSQAGDMQSTLQVTEVYASTRSYPEWWSDMDESRVLRRRKSMGGSVLERNLCFVDTPGFGNKNSCLESITPVVEYVEAQLQKHAGLGDMNESDMISMLSGNGGTQVDVVIYLFNQRVRSIDIDYLKRLSKLTNIIPLISKADNLSTDQIDRLKENIVCELEANEIRSTSLTSTIHEYKSNTSTPYAVSSKPSKDEETMDASLLMSPEYIQPLLPSELSHLVTQLFDPDTISYLRHSAARKFVQWRDGADLVSKPLSLYRPLAQNGMLNTSTILGSAPSYALARITDHTQREEKLAQIRLANWAADLQRSLQNERLQYENLAREERAVWLTERMGECVQDGMIVPISDSRPRSPTEKSIKGSIYTPRPQRIINSMNPHDPLGLLELNEEIKRKAVFALGVVSGFGVIGGLALWLSRGWRGVDVDQWISLV